MCIRDRIYADQIVSVDNKFYPSLSLRMYMLLNDTKEASIYDNSIVVDKTGLSIPSFSSYNGIQSYLKYYKIRPNSSFSHKTYSASDLIDSLDNIRNGEKPIIDPSEFNGKIVFVGANAKASAIKVIDELPTPMLSEHPGVDVQATNFNNLLNNELMRMSTFGQDVLAVSYTHLHLITLTKCSMNLLVKE